MNNFKRMAKISQALGIIALIGLILSALALNDIYHNKEPNLALEWIIIRISALFILMFILFSAITIFKLSKIR